jgi:transposase
MYTSNVLIRFFILYFDIHNNFGSSVKPSCLKRLGIDEIALVKGKGNYCTVLVDLDNSK